MIIKLEVGSLIKYKHNRESKEGHIMSLFYHRAGIEGIPTLMCLIRSIEDWDNQDTCYVIRSIGNVEGLK